MRDTVVRTVLSIPACTALHRGPQRWHTAVLTSIRSLLCPSSFCSLSQKLAQENTIGCKRTATAIGLSSIAFIPNPSPSVGEGSQGYETLIPSLCLGGSVSLQSLRRTDVDRDRTIAFRNQLWRVLLPCFLKNQGVKPSSYELSLHSRPYSGLR